jgi:glycerate 2-kinase
LVEGCPIVRAGTAAIPRHALLACEPFGARLDAASVAESIASGLRAAGQPEPDRLSLPARVDDHRTAELLEREGFHARMRAARAVVLAVPALSEGTLAGSSAFEIATLARQSGVPCYAIAAEAELNAFDLRILDLQIVLPARGRAGLRRAGGRLAELI